MAETKQQKPQPKRVAAYLRAALHCECGALLESFGNFVEHAMDNGCPNGGKRFKRPVIMLEEVPRG